MNRYGNDKRVHTGKVLVAHYNDTMKAIRMMLKFDNGSCQQFELPITMFKFKSDQNEDEEMRKTAKLLIGKNIDVMVDT